MSTPTGEGEATSIENQAVGIGEPIHLKRRWQRERYKVGGFATWVHRMV